MPALEDATVHRGELDDFYRKHRGGSGPVILMIVVDDFGDDPDAFHIFGSIEAAHAHRDTLGDNVTCVFSPYIVDDPGWGDRGKAS